MCAFVTKIGLILQAVPAIIIIITSYCSYARPAQPGPIRTRLCGPCIAAMAGDKVRFGPIRYLSLFRYFSVNVLPCWL